MRSTQKHGQFQNQNTFSFPGKSEFPEKWSTKAPQAKPGSLQNLKARKSQKLTQCKVFKIPNGHRNENFASN